MEETVVLFVIRDCAASSRLWTEMLVPSRWKVVVSDFGDDILSRATEFVPRMIVFDVTKPETKAADLLRKLKKKAPTSAIPILIVSSLTEKESIQLLDEGAVGFCHRSDLTSEVLVATIDRTLRHPAVSGNSPTHFVPRKRFVTSGMWL